jgi:hypothetical protein
VDLKSPSTLAFAWLVVPLLVVVAAAGLGSGLSRITDVIFGVLTVPAGFAAGVVLMTFALEIGFSGTVTVVLTATLALAGLLSALIPARRTLRAWRPLTEQLWSSGCGLAAFAIAMAPLAGSGRSGILGYVFNNDSSVHISAVELLRDHGAQSSPVDSSLFSSVDGLFSSGYPLGSHVWPLFGSVVGNIDAFHIWIPLIAVMAGMTALVVFAVVRWLGAPPQFAAIAGTVVASGYLPYSYLTQGSAKEIGAAFALYATIALLVLGLSYGPTLRALVPAAIGAAATLDVFGAGALAWLGPGAVAAALVALWVTGVRTVEIRKLGILAG